MLNSLSSWVKQIIMVVMFTAFVDFLMPNDSFLRYARVLLGLIVMITVINPVLTLINNENYFGEYRWNYNSLLVEQQNVLKRADAFNKKNNELIAKQYKNNLASFITSYIDENGIFKVKDIDIILNGQNEGSYFGSIDEVYILLKPGPARIKDKKDIQKVRKVSVKIDESDGYNVEGTEDLIDYRQSLSELKAYLQKQLGIPEKNIKLQLEGS